MMWGTTVAPFVLNAVVRYLYRLYSKRKSTSRIHSRIQKVSDQEDSTYVDDILTVGYQHLMKAERLERYNQSN